MTAPVFLTLSVIGLSFFLCSESLAGRCFGAFVLGATITISLLEGFV